MNRYQLFKALRHHRKLANRRALNYDQNRSAKFLVWFSSSFALLYLIFIAIMLSLIANSSRSTTSLEFIFGLSPFILLTDFGFRFMAQETPAHLAKPYYLLPIGRYACIDAFVGSSIITPYNLTWFVMLVPYCLMSVVFSHGLLMAVALLVVWWWLVVANSQWYLICKTLTTDTLLWWLLPTGVYAAMATPILLELGKTKGWVNFFELYAGIGTLMEHACLLVILGATGLAAGLTLVNRRLQYAHVRKELRKAESKKTHKVSQMSFFDRYGVLGLYLKLEIKSIMRNKNPRKSFTTTFFVVTIFSLIISFTDIYDGAGYASFWCLYLYLISGGMTAMQIMSYEGNYIDCLMTHKENLMMLLRSKYYLYSAQLLWPLMLMLPAVFSGKWQVLMLIAYAIFTAGFQFFVLFHLAIFNRQTMPLNTKFIGKNAMKGNYVQLAASLLVYLGPIVIVSLLQMVCTETVSYLIMMGIGLAFIALHPLWIRHIYNCWMKRRYDIMAAMRASR